MLLDPTTQHPWNGFCPDCENTVRAGTSCPKVVVVDEESTEPRFERHGAGPLPYETPPPPSRSRRFKKPHKVRP